MPSVCPDQEAPIVRNHMVLSILRPSHTWSFAARQITLGRDAGDRGKAHTGHAGHHRQHWVAIDIICSDIVMLGKMDAILRKPKN
jgi:hypothetical protein